MLAVVTTVKLLAEIAGLALLGQHGRLACCRVRPATTSCFIACCKWSGAPWVRAARWLAPRGVLDRHLPLVAGLALLFIWGGAAIAKVGICLRIGVALCK